MALTESASSPAQGGTFKSLEEEITYYKQQYEQLEIELQEFQQSSKELEAELEKDIDASEKRERTLKEKVESLRYEVDEWKSKYKQSKTEASNAQNGLQKEITTLRDTNRNLQLKLRDIEVANDDYERQARHTTSSLEDLESKYNQTIERSVMLEEEIKTGEQERETLRIEAQRLRDELSDLKVEAEITHEKLRAAEAAGGRKFKRISQLQEPNSPVSDNSTTSITTPTTSTPPPTTSDTSAATSDARTPPSPPLSETSAPRKSIHAGPILPKSKSTQYDTNITPRPSHYGTKLGRAHARGPSIGPANPVTPGFKQRTQGLNPRPAGTVGEHVPRSESLYQIRGLIGKVQRLEARVQSARSKLPAPTNTPPRASPRGTTTSSPASNIPATVTVRSSKKRGSTSTVLSSAFYSNPAETNKAHPPHHARPSAIGSAPGSDGAANERPSSRASNVSAGFVRPASRASVAHSAATAEQQRPMSAADLRRPRSSLSGSHGYPYMHKHTPGGFSLEEDEGGFTTPVARRTTLDRSAAGSAIPTPSGLTRRQSRADNLNGATPTARKAPRFSTAREASAGEARGGGATSRSESRQSTAGGDVGETF